MKFRSKVLMLCVGLTLSGHAVLATMDHFQLSRVLRHQAESVALSVASAAAVAVDPELVEAAGVTRPGNAVGLEYLRRLETELVRVRDGQRRPGLFVRRLFTLHRDPVSPARICYGVDLEEAGARRAAAGDEYPAPAGFEYHEVLAQVLPELAADDQGMSWVTAYAPVRDRKGRTVGLLGADVSTVAMAAIDRRIFTSAAAAFLISLALAVALSSQLGVWISRRLAEITEAITNIERGRLDSVPRLHADDEFRGVAHAIDGLRVALTQRENLKGALASYVSEEVTQSILSHGMKPSLMGERKKITVLFADVRGFTGLAEREAPEHIVGMLNDFMQRMVEVVMRNRGYLNKFMGDGLMAVFGANRDDEEHEVHAVQCALDMQQTMDVLRRHWRRGAEHADRYDLRIGIGVNTGVAVVGNIGSEQRMDYTAIGDAVNLASRLEAATKEYSGTGLLVGESTYKATRAVFDYVSIGKLQVRGKRRPVEAYTIPIYQRARERTTAVDETGEALRGAKP